MVSAGVSTEARGLVPAAPPPRFPHPGSNSRHTKAPKWTPKGERRHTPPPGRSRAMPRTPEQPLFRISILAGRADKTSFRNTFIPYLWSSFVIHFFGSMSVAPARPSKAARSARGAGRETAPSCSRRLNAASATLGYGDRSDLFEMPPERYRSLIHRTRRPKDGIG